MTDIPYGNFTALNHNIIRGWETSATKRGTSDIIYSCLVTITLCIYTSIHLNIPDPQETSRQKYLRLAKWVAIGIFAPEWIIFTAWRQWKDAREFLNDIKRYTETDESTKSTEHELDSVVITTIDETTSSHDEGSQPDSNNPKGASSQYNPLPRTEGHTKKGHVADMTYAFYVLMGGIRVDVSDISDQLQSVFLTREGLTDIVQNGGYYHIQLDKRLIDDHSKANYLAKLLVCCQVTWMATQCIARKAAGLPLTLLELHTFAHVFCALLIYMFWFKKPLSVDEGTVVTLPENFRYKIAYAMCLHHKQAVRIDLRHQKLVPDKRGPIHIREQNILQAERHLPQVGETCRGMIPGSLVECKNSTCQIANHLHWSHQREESNSLDRTAGRPNDSHKQDGIVKYDPNDDRSVLILNFSPAEDYIRIKVSLTDKDRLRWRLAAKPAAIRGTHAEMYGHSRQTTYPIVTDERQPFHKKLSNLLYRDPFLWALFDFGAYGSSIGFLDTGVAILIMPCVYGAIHLCAWDWAFPSNPEIWMWRVSALCITGTLPALKLMFSIFESLETGPVSPTITIILKACIWGLSLLITGLLICAFPLSRLFLVLEVFLSLRAVPIGVYATIPWTQYIPHL